MVIGVGFWYSVSDLTSQVNYKIQLFLAVPYVNLYLLALSCSLIKVFLILLMVAF